MKPTIITPEFLERAMAADEIRVIDVRTPAEYEETHIEGSFLLPLDRFGVPALRELAGGKPCALVCRSGMRAAQALKKIPGGETLEAAVLEGGLAGWESAGLPLKRGRSSLSLERQVRIAAGLLVLLGVSLGFTLHPVFFGLAAFVGAGLVFAGLTDWCGMGLLLAKMPWNRRGGRGNSAV